MSPSGCLHERERLSWLFLNEASVLAVLSPFFFQSGSGPHNYRELTRDQLVLIEAGTCCNSAQIKNTAVSTSRRVSSSSSVALGEIGKVLPEQTKSVAVTFPAIRRRWGCRRHFQIPNLPSSVESGRSVTGRCQCHKM